MATLKYTIGDATDPQGPGYKIIPHVCNDEGRWGSGFVVALSNKWDRPESDYRRKHERFGLKLGEVVDSIVVPGEIYVCNMVAQHSTGKGFVDNYESGGRLYEFVRRPIRYGALAQAMRHVGASASQVGASIHAPRFGAGLAGGEWRIIEALILELWVDQGIDVTIYDLEQS